MNEELKAIVIRAGAPAEMFGEMWFHIFCRRFAQEILDQAVEELQRLRRDTERSE